MSLFAFTNPANTAPIIVVMFVFKQFVGNETVTSHKLEENFDLYLPSITLCGPSGFKSAVEKYSDLELESYLNNTVDLEDILINIYDRDHNYIDAKFVEGTIYNKSNIWKVGVAVTWTSERDPSPDPKRLT